MGDLRRFPLVGRMALRERVGRNLRRLRHARGLSQEELAHRAEVSGNHVGHLEREEKAATIDVLERLARVLEVDPLELLQPDRG